MLKVSHGISSSQRPIFFSGANMITHWDLQNTESYNGVGNGISDLDGTNDGLIVGTVPYTQNTTNYLSLDSTVNNYIRTTTNLNPFLSPANTGVNTSIFCWVYPTSNGIVISEQGTTTPDTNWYDSQIEWINGDLTFSVWPYPNGIGNGGWIVSNIPAGLNAWHYVGLTYDGATLRGYVNGSLAGSAAMVRQTPYNVNTLGLYYTVGYPTQTDQGANVGSNFRFGALHIWNTALSGEQIFRNYRATKNGYGL